MITYNTIILVTWAVFIFIWALLAFSVKRDVRGKGISSIWYRFFLLRLALVALVVFVAVRIARGTAHYASADPFVFESTVFAPPLLLGWLAALLAVMGIAFAVWARFHLGTNWSPAPAVKEGHELITSGPYQWVRHPIYTGVILAALGTALTGTPFGIGTFLIACVIFVVRIGKEERIMLELFPNSYPAYQARTKKLIPFVW